MVSMPSVSNSERFTILSDIIREEAMFVISGFFNLVKRTPALDNVWHDANFDSCERSYGILLAKFEDYAKSVLPGDMWSDATDRLRAAVLHIEVAQASDMEPHEEAAVWDAWDRQDAQTAFDEKLAMYLNEY